MARRGFTLLELLVAVVILSVVVAVVYASFASVLNSVDAARVGAEEMRLREFLIKSFSTNLSTVYVDPYMEQEVFQFIGEDERGPHGPADTLRFCSTAPLLGGMALPGDIKEVIYSVTDEKPEDELNLGLDEGENSAGDEYRGRMLVSTEVPLLGANVQGLEGDTGFFEPDSDYVAPSWSVPIRTFDVKYYDGEEWVDDWNSVEMGLLPWCVQIQINFARTPDQLEAERAAGVDPEEDPDLTLVLPIPVGLGQTESSVRQFLDPSLQGLGYTGGRDGIREDGRNDETGGSSNSSTGGTMGGMTGGGVRRGASQR